MLNTFSGWTLLSDGSGCNKQIGSWRYKNEPLSRCSAYCGGQGAVALVYREENGNCACCKDPSDLYSSSTLSVYVLPGIRFFIHRFHFIVQI